MFRQSPRKTDQPPQLRELGTTSDRRAPHQPPPPVIGIASTSPLPQWGKSPHIIATPAPPVPDRHHATVWLDGDVLMCACPDCGAPLAVRIWLMRADCWRCGTCIALTAEQERLARQLLDPHQRQSQDTAPRADVPQRHSAEAPAAPRGGTIRAGAPSAPTATAPVGATQSAGPPLAQQATRQREAVTQASRRALTRRAGSLFQNMPAWLVSLLFHVILLILLALLTYQERPDLPYITLSTRVSRVVREGGSTTRIEPTDMSVFDLGVPAGVDMQDPEQRRAMVRADQEARQLRLVDPRNPHLPDIEETRRQLTTSTPDHQPLLARDPRLRVDVVRSEGGTTLTEAAVARGLAWLARHQGADGSWSVDRFERDAHCHCGGAGSLHSNITGTALALLPFLGAGQTHLSGMYKDNVATGLRWLVQHQREDGDLRGSEAQYPGMYTQGQAAIVLCEAFLMTGDETLRRPAQTAIDFIVDAQYPDGGWRYFPKRRGGRMQGDTSVFGWQLMGLQSAAAANLHVPDETLENAGYFLDSVQLADGAQYAYMRREKSTPPMTAEGLLCRIYLGWDQNRRGLVDGVSWMLESHPPNADKPNIYYWYYATQVMHHYGGPQWTQWNLTMRDVLINAQEDRGHRAGSWSPDGPLSSQGGRLYMTSLAICCLEVYYRHLPIFRQIDLTSR